MRLNTFFRPDIGAMQQEIKDYSLMANYSGIMSFLIIAIIVLLIYNTMVRPSRVYCLKQNKKNMRECIHIFGNPGYICRSFKPDEHVAIWGSGVLRARGFSGVKYIKAYPLRKERQFFVAFNYWTWPQLYLLARSIFIKPFNHYIPGNGADMRGKAKVTLKYLGSKVTDAAVWANMFFQLYQAKEINRATVRQIARLEYNGNLWQDIGDYVIMFPPEELLVKTYGRLRPFLAKLASGDPEKAMEVPHYDNQFDINVTWPELIKYFGLA